MSNLKGVKIIDKPERGRYEEKEVHENSSKVLVYNVFEQSWSDLQQAGLSHLFKSKEEFERRKDQHLKGGENT